MSLIMAGSLPAGELPQLTEKPWLGCFAGHEGRGFDFAVQSDGESKIYFKRGSKRLSFSTIFPVYYILEEEINGKWVSRRMQEDGFETGQEATDEPEKLTFTATYTGDTKVEITHEFDREGVVIGTRILEKTTTNPIRCGVRVTIPDLYRNLEEDGKLDERELKRKVDAEVSGETRSGEGVKADLYEKPQLDGPDYFPDGARTFTFECEKIDGQELTLSTVDESAGWIQIEQTKTAFNGFNLFWWPDPAKAGTPGARLKIEVD